MKLSRQFILQTLTFVICFATLVLSLPACSSDDDRPLPGIEEDSNGRALRQLTISDASLTRATIDDATLAARWSADDVATYVNLSALSGEIHWGNLTAASSAQTTLLEGDVYCGLGDHLAVIYPSVTPQYNNASAEGSYTVVLSGQKGTLADVGQHFHYVFGVAAVTKVEDYKATGEASPMTSLLALCKFSFSDGTTPIAVKTLKISYGSNGTAGYPQTGTVTLDANSSADDVTVLPASLASSKEKVPLTITLNQATSEGVYVALFPVAQSSTFHFTVEDPAGNTYIGTATARLKAGKYYASSLQLTK